MLVKAHTELLQEEFQRLLDQDKEEDLNRMYNLLHRIPDGLDPLRVRFEEHVKRVGLNAVERIVTGDKDVVSADVAQRHLIANTCDVGTQVLCRSIARGPYQECRPGAEGIPRRCNIRTSTRQSVSRVHKPQ